MKISDIEEVEVVADIIIIGGGAAGCQAAIRAKELNPDLKVVIVEKAGIERSGCLAAGVNAINAYLNEGETPESFVKYVAKESSGLIREDLVYTIAERLNLMSEKLEKYGLIFKKTPEGKYEPRGRASVKINGENIKPVLADAVRKSGTVVYNKVNCIELINENGKISGVYGVGVVDGKFYIFRGRAVIIATGGASGLYKPNNPGAARHKMWYSPFNTGAGLAMGIRAGAEMTTFEMRFIALRTKDTASPTGTIAQGIKAKQINSYNEEYMERYLAKTTPWRLYATIKENEEGRGPCFLDTCGIDTEMTENLKKAYLNMSPSIVLKWSDEDIDPSKIPIEINGSEPYVNGGHGQAGYWVRSDRGTTLDGLYAAGDICGGAPKKYVTGSMAEGEIAAESALKYIEKVKLNLEGKNNSNDAKVRVFSPMFNKGEFSPDEIEERMQKVMDEYAGGISEKYRVSAKKLLIAKNEMAKIENDLERTKVSNVYELIKFYENAERVVVARAVIEHLMYRKETRWKCYQERVDYPLMDNSRWLVFVNSVYKDGEFRIFERDVGGGKNGS